MTTSAISPRVILIGIAGPSGCGKTTYATYLVERLQSPTLPIGLDDFFYRYKFISHPLLGSMRSCEDPDTLHVENLLNLLQTLKQHPEKRTRHHRNDVSIINKKYIYIIVEGFLLFALSDELTSIFDIRIFFDSTMSECRMRRFRRHSKIDSRIPDSQVIITEKFQQWFDYLVWTEYLKRRDSQMSKAEKTFHSDEYQNRQYTQIDNYIDTRLKEIIEQNS
ncbi:hypothetical protein I4U23_001211 [Adineta vaga]|nr:hypothetical protein I4U23_001211 [Adineta vaga]